MSWSKHAGSRNVYAVDFAEQLSTNETLTGAPVVRIMRQGVDVSADFLSGIPVIDGTDVRVVLASAAAGQQAGGVYTVYAECSTSAGNQVAATVALAVDAEGQA
jgi:uncharacterized protein (DUF433 family)